MLHLLRTLAWRRLLDYLPACLLLRRSTRSDIHKYCTDTPSALHVQLFALQPALSSLPSPEKHRKPLVPPKEKAQQWSFSTWTEARHRPTFQGSQVRCEKGTSATAHCPTLMCPTCLRPTAALHSSCGIDPLPDLLFSLACLFPPRLYSPSPDTTGWLVIAWQSHGPQDNGWRQPYGLCPEISAASGPARYERRVNQGKLCPRCVSPLGRASSGRLRALSPLPWAGKSLWANPGHNHAGTSPAFSLKSRPCVAFC